MLGITLSVDEIEAAPPDVRRWLKHEIACSLGTRWASEPANRTGLLSNHNIKPWDNGPIGQIRTVTKGASPKKEIEMVDVRAPVYDEEIRKLIAARAYELWENQARPHGCDLINWHQAEQEILSRMGNGRKPVAHESARTTQSNSGSQTKPVMTATV